MLPNPSPKWLIKSMPTLGDINPVDFRTTNHPYTQMHEYAYNSQTHSRVHIHQQTTTLKRRPTPSEKYQNSNN